VDKEKILVRHGASPRAWRPELAKTPPARRVRSFDEYVPALTREQAVAEAGRCLACGCGAGCQICHDLCKMFAYTIDGAGRVCLDESKCVACGVCAQRCPGRFIEMVRSSEEPV
jgi:Fe-S-cluster-containing hydrogenase component 2